ncbi:MAG: PorP/SprF family type IX secretion system membrane protein [Cyclobacteriaceae bacterium]
MLKILRSFTAALGLVLICNIASAQDPAVFSQYSLNPFQFNPSYIANNGYAEVNLFYRKQWLGVENAPEVGAFNVQAPVGRSVSLGLTVISNKTILLSTNSALATFGYRARFGLNHHLTFGLSGGMGFNNLDGEALANNNDPALANVALNNKHLEGQVGINYQLKNFNLGFALPKLFSSNPETTQEMEPVEFDPLVSKFGSVSYAINAGSVEFLPVVLYRGLDTEQDQWEGMLMATFKKMLWLGASYRDGYGLTGFIGIRIKGAFKVGYAYEHPTESISNAANGSHEVYFGARISKRNREEELFAERMVKDSIDRIAKNEANLEKERAAEEENDVSVSPVSGETEPEVVVKEEQTKETVIAASEPAPEEPQVVVTPQTAAQPPPPQPTETENRQEVETMVKDAKSTNEANGFYVVVGVYRNADNAASQMGNLRSRGFNPNIVYIEQKDYYYVHLLHTQNREEAVLELSRLKQRNQFFGAWIYNHVAR